MKVLYLYMFPMWGNGSGAWLRRLNIRMHQQYPDKFESIIIAPDKSRFTRAIMRPITPKNMGVFVGNPNLTKARKFSDWSSKDHIENYALYLSHAAKVAHEFKPDLIHAFHSAWLPSVANMISHMFNIPFILMTHGSDLYYLQEDSRWIGPMRDASDNAKLIIANSAFTRKFYTQLIGKRFEKKMRTIPAGVSHNVKITRNTEWIDKKFKPINGKIVLFTGRLIEHKGVEYLIRAARDIDATVCILGSGPDKPRLEKLIKHYKLKNVHMIPFYARGELSKIYDFYRRADVYVAPSIWKEPLGMVILESMIFETPVVTTNQGGAAWIVKDGHNGYLVRPRSAGAIAEKVNRILNDSALRQKLGKNARSSVLKQFTWKKVAEDFWNVYEKAVA